MSMNNNQSVGMNAKFRLRVTVTGVKDKMETILSPQYQYKDGELVTISFT